MGDFQPLTPVGDKLVYTEVNVEAYLLFNHIQNVVILKQPQQQVRNSPEELKFQLILQHCQQDSLIKQEWMDLSEWFVLTAYDSNYVSWYQAHWVLYDNKSTFEYNMSMVQTLETQITKLQARHNCSEAKKNIPKKQMDYIPVYTLQRDPM